MIEIKNGFKSFKDGDRESIIFQNLNLSIQQGEFVSIMGRSGSGKSTLLHVLGCMDRLQQGEYFFGGQPLHDMKDNELSRFRSKHFGFVFQSFYLIREFTALQNVEAPMGYAGIPTKERKKHAIELLNQVDLKAKMNHYPEQLSGGQQQRVAIARALSNSPDVIFADEPTGNLDRENGDLIIELLKRLHQNGTTLILVTHDEKLGKMAEKRIMLEDGNLSFY